MSKTEVEATRETRSLLVVGSTKMNPFSLAEAKLPEKLGDLIFTPLI